MVLNRSLVSSWSDLTPIKLPVLYLTVYASLMPFYLQQFDELRGGGNSDFC
jgi:hypothetical protein